ncbi:MAG: hypothetical protein JSV88_19845 [Candidatus Aminicenantes bacterium]|nr:MAG: hypothetical protein JSV88_19845 [Candidatus Aminicenantes bacterium]
MKDFKRNCPVKWITLFLAVLLLWGGHWTFPQEARLEGLFQWAIKKYLEGMYREVINDMNQFLSLSDEDDKELNGKVYLLIGAAYEQLGNIPEARKNYQLSLELLDKPTIEGINLSFLPEYQRIIMKKQKPTEPQIIEKPGLKPGKRKRASRLYLVLGGVVIAGLVAFLVLKKDKPSQYFLITSIEGQGSIELAPPGGRYARGTTVTLRAIPDVGWQFDFWSGDLTGSENPATITMNSRKNVTAAFTELPPSYYTLTVSSEGQGTVTLDPGGGTYTPGTEVRLTATPAAGWEFYRWYGDLSGSQNPTHIIMNANKNVTAGFIGPGGIMKTVGHHEVFSSISTNAYRIAMPFTMPENGTIYSITMYHLGGRGMMIMGVYDGERRPLNRLGVTAETNVESSAGWQTIGLTDPVFVQGGQIIWLAWVYESNPGVAYESGSPGRFRSDSGWAGGMPDTFGSGIQHDYIYSIYATYTPN